MGKLDKKDCIILNLLQENCRMSLTEISKNVDLSVDSVKKRIEKMIKNKAFYPKIQLRPRNFGFGNIVNINIKLHNYTKEDVTRFINYLVKNPNVAEVFSLSGEWDFSIVMIAKNAENLGSLSDEIRNNFYKIINTWSESITTCTHKFERYNMLDLMGFKEE